MNKVLKLSTLLLAFAVIFSSCSTKESKEAAETTETEATSDEWKQLDSFHLTMAEVFHPLKDSGNLEPAKKMMAQLADEADKLSSSELPAKVNTDDVKAKLSSLKADSRALADAIAQGADDATVSTKLRALHDLFHEIQEAWYKGGEGHEHH